MMKSFNHDRLIVIFDYDKKGVVFFLDKGVSGC